MAIVRYMVKDTQESIAFFTENLGFSLEQNFGPFAIVVKDDLTLWLADPRTSAAQPMSDGSIPQPGGWNRLVLEVVDDGPGPGASTHLGTGTALQSLEERLHLVYGTDASLETGPGEGGRGFRARCVLPAAAPEETS